MNEYDIVIIGGGIIGLSTAMQLKKIAPQLKVALLEKEASLARHQTGNNSGVIHAGVYYRPGSLKAVNCRRGYEQLLEFCDHEGIMYDLCGKLIIATSEDELPRLDNLFDRAIQNGLSKVIKLPGEAIKDYEPHATGLAAIWVPYTGITDFSAISNRYADVFVNRHGGVIHTNTKVTDIDHNSSHALISSNADAYSARLVINTAGLFSDEIARFTHPDLNVRIIPFRGEYVMLKKEKNHLVKNLIYPVPDPNFPFLGVHFTRRIEGGIEAGPNAVWAFKREGYKKTDFDAGEFFGALGWKGFRKVMMKYWRMGLGEYYRSCNKYALARALQKLVPEVQAGDLAAGGAGVRAQACDKNGGLIDDFLFVEDKFIINVLNAPSPAATASLSIGESIAEKALARFN